MKNLLIRGISGVVFVLLIVGSLLCDSVAFAAIFAVFCIAALYEYADLRKKTLHLNFGLPMLIAGFAVYSVFFIETLLMQDYPWLIAGVVAVYVILVLPLLLSRKVSVYSEILFGITYIAFPFSLLLLLPNLPSVKNFDVPVVLCLMILIWTYDTFAYLTGILFGKHKLAEKISPKKTWEGAAGGALFCIAAAVLLSQYVPQMDVIRWILFAVIVIVAGTAGDLFESGLKRKAGVKDSGRIMPGHGGILDRFDSVLFISPFAFLFFSLIR